MQISMEIKKFNDFSDFSIKGFLKNLENEEKYQSDSNFKYNTKDLKKAIDFIHQLNFEEKLGCYEFIISDKIPSSLRFKFANFGQKTYDPVAAKKKELKKLITKLLNDSKWVIPLGPTFMKIKLYQEVPKSFNKLQKLLAIGGIIRPTTRPDIDNLEKTILDSSKNILWNDDTQVIKLETELFYGYDYRCEILYYYIKENYNGALTKSSKAKTEESVLWKNKINQS